MVDSTTSSEFPRGRPGDGVGFRQPNSGPFNFESSIRLPIDLPAPLLALGPGQTPNRKNNGPSGSGGLPQLPGATWPKLCVLRRLPVLPDFSWVVLLRRALSMPPWRGCRILPDNSGPFNYEITNHQFSSHVNYNRPTQSPLSSRLSEFILGRVASHQRTKMLRVSAARGSEPKSYLGSLPPLL
ncbi:Protein of unknown function [Pyronema omphalodes CBS 100304]|uniref:Uncharacterized protein n=1 Tax=Pyronema omphalodes (strain CBS 100304) TaxID=1076935 RepID=U4LN14_PYROM|nr:Protein of unknown function [Pyronema omphalodes CBS 100304]